MRATVLSIFAILSVCGISSGQEYNLTLEQSVELAKRKSYSMQRLEQNLEIAENNLKATVAALRTNIYLDLTAPNYRETIQTWEDSTGTSFFPVKTLTSFGGVTISQPLPTDGSIQVTSGLSSVNDYYTDMRAVNFYTQLRLEQPLHSLWSYNSIRANLKTARLNYELTSRSLRREELNLVYSVSSAYYNLLLLQTRREIALLDLERQSEAYEISRKKFEAGLLREVDALQMEVDLAQAQNSYDMEVVNEKAAANRFKELVGLELDADITLNDELLYSVVTVDPDLAVDLALENRMEMKESDIQIELQELTIKERKSEGQIRANLSAYFERSGVSREELDRGLGNTLGSSFRDYRHRPSNYGVGLTVRIPILDWGRNRALVRAAQIRLNQNRIEKTETERAIETEVRNMVDNIAGNLRQLQIFERAVEVAEKSFEITLQRFTDGDIDSQALALERTRLNTAYTTRLNAYINYKLLLADLQRATFYDFQNNRPILEP